MHESLQLYSNNTLYVTLAYNQQKNNQCTNSAYEKTTRYKTEISELSLDVTGKYNTLQCKIPVHANTTLTLSQNMDSKTHH